MLRRRHWIPPLGLLSSHLAHLASWIVLFAIAGSAERMVTMGALAWIHLVALGWLTMTALSVLIHAIPAFTDNQWRAESAARGSLAVYAAGVVVLVVAFGMDDVALLPIGAAVLAVGLGIYLLAAFATLFVPPPADPIDRAIARALGITLFFLAVALGLGYAQSLSLERGTPVAMRLAPVHADLALIGWLSLLVVGVSSRTLRPITGNPARQPALHIAVGTAGVLGVVVSSLGLLWNAVALIWGGAAILAVALLLYVAQVIRIFSGLQNPHRPPQAFALASVGWLIVAGYLGMSAAFGRPAGTAFIFVALVGWIGQMVVAHIHHIGIRLIATIVRGDEDETRPIELLDGRLSWPCFVLFQSAVAAGTVGLLGASARAIEVAGLCGIVGWTLMSANLILAWRNAHRPATIVLV
jgi:hypothetical protein